MKHLCFFLTLIVTTAPLSIIGMDDTNTVRRNVLTNSYTPRATTKEDAYYRCIPPLRICAIRAATPAQLAAIQIEDLRDKALHIKNEYSPERLKYKALEKTKTEIIFHSPLKHILKTKNRDGFEFFLAHTDLTSETCNTLLDMADGCHFLEGMYLIIAKLTKDQFLEGSFVQQFKNPLDKALVTNSFVGTPLGVKQIDGKSFITSGCEEKPVYEINPTDLNQPKSSALFSSALMALSGDETALADAAQEHPLFLAAEYNNPTAIALLVENGVNISTKRLLDETALHRATDYNAIDAMKILVEKGSDTNAQWKLHGSTPLHIAVTNNSIEALEILLKNKATRVSIKNKFGQTPLHKAVEFKLAAITQMLLDRGADVHAKDNADATPLYTAVWTNTPDIAQLLIKHGADVTAKNAEGKTPLDCALEKKYTEILQILEHAATHQPSLSTASTN